MIYRNPRAWRVRIAQAAVWLMAGSTASLAALSDPSTTPPTDLAVVWGGTAFALACVIGMEIYLRLYALRIERDEDVVQVTTLATLHHRTVDLKLDSLLGEERHDQGSFGLAPSFNNSWITLLPSGRRLPFIIDVTPPADLNRAELERVLGRRRSRGDGRREPR